MLVSVGTGAACVTAVGDPAGEVVLVLTGGGGAETVKVWPTDVPPPGAGVKTEIFRAPEAAMSLARMLAVSWVAETAVVVRLDPLTWRTEVPEKLVPAAVTVTAGPPAATVVGPMLVSVGAGRGGVVTVKARAFEVPPPGPGLTTLTWAVPTLAISVAGMLAWSCVLRT